MVKLTPQETAERWARKSFMSFLEGRKTLNWIIGIIRSSEVRGQDLEGMFNGLRDYEDKARWKEAYDRCRTEGWL